MFEPIAGRLSEEWVMQWHHTLARCHGVLAGWSLLVLGWLLARHMTPAWRMRPLRLSGVVLGIVFAVLMVSGQFLQYGDDGKLREEILAAHGWIGLALLLPLLWHLFRHRRHRRFQMS